ncbi:Na+/H+ antiporter NhaA [Aestuariivirga sp.]|uniref:Na+/H+ antiporter NhaA n=1 Tax=Aestuariivirga sp. TaxID=2650926 RepID=UPI00391CF1CC
MSSLEHGEDLTPRSRLAAFLQNEATAGLILASAAALAIVLYNIELAKPYYSDLLQAPLRIGFAEAELAKPLLLWINDGLMAVFFFLVGLELKREFLEGNLSFRDQIILPAIAAAGGMAVPAVIYFVLNGNHPELLSGWAIPAATDIAFALGALSLAGRAVPFSLKVFLLTLAARDDLGAIVIIALFYTAHISTLALALAGLAGLFLLLLNRIHYSHTGLYILSGIVLWLCVLESGVHATLAGVVLGLAIPLTRRDGRAFLYPIEHALHPYVKFMILPVFAFANAGLPVEALALARAMEPPAIGIAAGLFIGKPLGIVAACWLAVRLRLSQLPQDCNWTHVVGVGFLAGIGFTMSLFIGALAFDSETAADAVRTGVLYGSLLSCAAGLALLRFAVWRA